MLTAIGGNLLRRLGYQAVRTEFLFQFNLGINLRMLFDSQGIDVVWDIGANRGQYRRMLREEVNFRGTILSFEPVPALFASLQAASSADPDWHVFPFALGLTAETREINITKSDDLSSFLKPTQAHTERFRDSAQVAAIAAVEVRRLNDVFPELSARFPASRPYLKIDTQGFDMQVVAGGTDVLSSFVGLQTEASVIPLYEGMLDYRETISQLNKRGFELSGVFPIGRDELLRMIEFDCVMVNPKQIRPITPAKR